MRIVYILRGKIVADVLVGYGPAALPAIGDRVIIERVADKYVSVMGRTFEPVEDVVTIHLSGDSP